MIVGLADRGCVVLDQPQQAEEIRNPNPLHPAKPLRLTFRAQPRSSRIALPVFIRIANEWPGHAGGGGTDPKKQFREFRVHLWLIPLRIVDREAY